MATTQSSRAKRSPLKYSYLERYENRILKIVLPNILQPDLILHRLSSATLEYIEQFGVQRWTKVKTVFPDHNYLQSKRLSLEQVDMGSLNSF